MTAASSLDWEKLLKRGFAAAFALTLVAATVDRLDVLNWGSTYCAPADMPAAQAWFNGLERKDEWKPLPGCPGYDDVDPGNANLILNGVTFAVPRSSFGTFGDSLKADGAASSFSLFLDDGTFHLRGLKERKGGGEIRLHIKRVTIDICQDDKRRKCASIRERMWKVDSKGPHGVTPEIPSEIQGLRAIRLSEERVLYFEGEHDPPLHWGICHWSDHCRSRLYFHPGIGVDYDTTFGIFSTRRQELHVKILDLLQSLCSCSLQPLHESRG